MSETELQMVTRHLEQAQRIVAEQRARITEMDQDGGDTRVARGLMETFEGTLRASEEHLDRLRAHPGDGDRLVS